MNEREKHLSRRRELYQKNKERVAAQSRDRYFRKKEQYAEAKKRWKEENRDKYKESTKKYNDSVKEIRKEWFRENKNILNEKQRKRRANRTEEQKNKDREYRKMYRELNKDKIKEYHKSISPRRRVSRKKYFEKKYRTDIQYKLLHNLRSRIKNVLKGIAKDSTTMRLIGCTLKEFQEHIESKFTEEMSWEKVLDGSIHIDHIKPCSRFDLTNPLEQKECFHYTNLQPLWAIDNLKKGAKCIID